jgi:hypothetical protein
MIEVPEKYAPEVSTPTPITSERQPFGGDRSRHIFGSESIVSEVRHNKRA